MSRGLLMPNLTAAGARATTTKVGHDDVPWDVWFIKMPVIADANDGKFKSLVPNLWPMGILLPSH